MVPTRVALAAFTGILLLLVLGGMLPAVLWPDQEVQPYQSISPATTIHSTRNTIERIVHTVSKATTHTLHLDEYPTSVHLITAASLVFLFLAVVTAVLIIVAHSYLPLDGFEVEQADDPVVEIPSIAKGPGLKMRKRTIIFIGGACLVLFMLLSCSGAYYTNTRKGMSAIDRKRGGEQGRNQHGSNPNASVPKSGGEQKGEPMVSAPMPKPKLDAIVTNRGKKMEEETPADAAPKAGLPEIAKQGMEADKVEPHVSAMETMSKQLKIMTFNVYSKQHVQYTGMDQHDVDLLFTQEDNYQTDFGKYKQVSASGHGSERVACYRNDKNDRVTTRKEYHRDPPVGSGLARRFGVTVGVDGLRVSSVHLEGGRFADQALLVGPNFETMLEHKTGLLRQMVEDANNRPDIIMGDFNCVYASDPNRVESFMDGQYNYFATRVKNAALTDEDKDRIRRWNLDPIAYLLANGYELAPIENEASKATSLLGNSIIDHVFVRRDALAKYSNVRVQVIPHFVPGIFPPAYSDHNPVILTLSP